MLNEMPRYHRIMAFKVAICHNPSPSQKSKGLGVTLFCCATHHHHHTLWFKLNIENSVPKFYSGLWESRV